MLVTWVPPIFSPSICRINLGASGLLGEAFAAVEGVKAIGARDVIVLSTNAHIALGSLLGQALSGHHKVTGLITGGALF